MRRGILLIVAVCLCATAARADIYMYRDRAGVLHFSNAPSEPAYRPFVPDFSGWVRRMGPIVDRERYQRYDQIIRDAAHRNGVDTALVKAVIRAESDFVPQALSPKGAQGLMQLMPSTAHRHNVWRVWEPRQNVEGGVRHLRMLLDRYSGNIRLAVAAYNAGEKAVDNYGGVPPYPETVEYLARVLRFRDHYLRAQ
ncbi:MAG: lytic transglycosylase domain-containing protein [Deltaproteobacteria bacterium]|nr:lytic transglycosylase domain-containing protein [Deltaproteobacteria bacterium]MBI3390772.1 lytic transglycosylase domain-containing protein [Deltaproteobacteria bacterium]